MAAQSTTQNTNGAHGRAELRHIPLSRITVQEGFNPRGEIIDAELDAMAETMRERGCLQPVLVRSTGGEDYLLIAGERRYRAATKAELTEIPANVLPAGAGDEAERLELLTDAMIENEVRSDLNPLQRAQGYKAMLDCGLNVRGVAERLGGKAKRSSRERRIRDHLTILALPDALSRLVAAETIPLLAVKALAELCKIHEELARNAVAAVLNGEDGEEAPAWSEFANDALSLGVLHTDPLPAGLFQSNRRYPVGAFTLGEKAEKNLIAYEKATGRKLESVSFTPDLVEHARRLKAVHEIGRWSQLIVGQDVGDALAEDYIAQSLKAVRARIKAERDAERMRSAAQPPSGAPEAGSDGESAKTETAEEREARIKEEAKAQRKEQEEKREKATRFNEAVGLLVFKYLPRIKVDERVLRILASVNLSGELRGIAARGARLALPGWISQSSQGDGDTKTVYLEAQEAHERASRYLADAQAAGDIAGRALTLIALASLADEEVIATQRRSYYTLHFNGPLAAAAERDLNAIVRERIKEGQLPALDDILTERTAKDEENARRETEIAQALARLDGVSDRLDQLDGDELDRAIADADLVWGEFHPETGRLRDAQEQRATEADTEDASESEEEQVPGRGIASNRDRRRCLASPDGRTPKACRGWAKARRRGGSPNPTGGIMGWTAGQLEGPFTARAAIEFDLGADFAARVIDAVRYGKVVYAAVRAHKGDEIFGLVLLTEREKGLLYTKPVSEDMGPVEDGCPARILDLLSTPSNDHAREWRERCRARLAKPLPRKGQSVVFADPLTFTNAEVHRTFTYEGGSRFRAVNGCQCHIRHWRELHFSLRD